MLNIKSNYSLLDSSVSLKDLVAKAKEFEYDYLALCDKQVMYGTIQFYELCKANNIHPIIGLEIMVSIEQEQYPFILIAKNNKGYNDLMTISSMVKVKETEYIEYDELLKYSSQVYVFSAGNDGIIERLILNQKNELANDYLVKFKNDFEGRFLISLYMFQNSESRYVTDQLLSFSDQLEITIIANDIVTYLKPEDAFNTLVLRAIKNNNERIDINQILEDNNEFLKTKKQLLEVYGPKLLAKTSDIAYDCQVDIKFGNYHLPVYPTPNKVDGGFYLESLCLKGLERRFINSKVNDVYLKRLRYELDVIRKMGLSDYFLIVWDYVKYAKNKGIFVGPGRGSAAGSLVAYCLGITNVDPVKYNLLFERFLNPERINMPDIDVDFPDNRREEVIRYVAERYGKYRVAQIVTFSTFGPKLAIRDVGRVMNIGLSTVNEMSRLLGKYSSITEAYEKSKLFKNMIDSKKEYEKLYQVCKSIEGGPRNVSIHAAGAIIADATLTNYVPLQQGMNGIFMTQYSMEYLEKLGLLKMDLLGLSNLTIMDNIINNVKANEDANFDINKINIHDFKTFDLLSKGETLGIFQLESIGVKNVLINMKVNSFEDIVATTSLYRPGPMQNIEVYIKRKLHYEPVHYLHKDLEGILKSTYGIIVYQEQIMQIAQKMAGFSLGKADILRKAISKKNENEIRLLYNDFVQGAVRKGYSIEIAKKVYELIFEFANYGFPRAHAVSYALIAYQMAFLKANYPLYFFSALLSAFFGNETKMREYINECSKYGIKLLYPSINYSQHEFNVENGSIRFSLLAVKSVGRNTYHDIEIERQQGGKFTGFKNFISRMQGYRMSTAIIESLIDANAFSEFNVNRTTLKNNLEMLIQDVKFNSNHLFDDEYQMMEYEDDSLTVLENEKKVLGLYLSGHPIKHVKLQYGNYQIIDIEDVINHNYAWCIGTINRVKPIKTKTNKLMAFINFVDDTGNIDISIFPDLYAMIANELKSGKRFLIQVKVQPDKRISANKIEKINI